MGFNISKENAEKIIQKCYSIADFCRALGVEPRGGNYKTFHRYVKEYKLDTSHFTGQKSNICNKNNKHHEYSVEEYLQSNHIRGKVLIQKLVKEGIKERKCELCGLKEWQNQEIPLEVHHIDGNTFNNTLENIQLLCPNCHSLTENFRGKQNKKAKEYFCKKCGAHITKWSSSGLCVKCMRETQRKIERPTLEELEKLLATHSCVAVGKMFNVSDTTIKKWVKRYKNNNFPN